jgi:hypothetical protein
VREETPSSYLLCLGAALLPQWAASGRACLVASCERRAATTLVCRAQAAHALPPPPRPPPAQQACNGATSSPSLSSGRGAAVLCCALSSAWAAAVAGRRSASRVAWCSQRWSTPARRHGALWRGVVLSDIWPLGPDVVQLYNALDFAEMCQLTAGLEPGRFAFVTSPCGPSDARYARARQLHGICREGLQAARQIKSF